MYTPLGESCALSEQLHVLRYVHVTVVLRDIAIRSEYSYMLMIWIVQTSQIITNSVVPRWSNYQLHPEKGNGIVATLYVKITLNVIFFTLRVND